MTRISRVPGLKQIRLPVAIFAALCGLVTAAGGLATWIAARGPRPAMGMDHISVAKMLVYTVDDHSSFWASAGLAVVVLGAAMVIGALTGLRTLTALAALLALAAAGMWIGLVVHYYNTPGLPNSYYLNPANLPWADLRAGAWMTICGAVLGIISAFFLRQRASRPGLGQQRGIA